MVVAYKHIAVTDGLIILFQSEIPDFDKGVPIGYVKYEGQACIFLGETHLVPLDTNIIAALEQTAKLYVMAGKPTEYEVATQGAIHLDKIFIGKIMAYFELDHGYS